MNLHRIIAFFLCLCFLPLFSPPTTSANTRAGQPILFAETGHTLAYNFRHFYERQGGLPIFGFPITEVFIENGRPVQYFERARLEWHADVGRTLVTHLGRWAAQSHGGHPAFQPVSAAPADTTYIPETQHSVNAVFQEFWRNNGGLMTFGFPISEQFMERNPQDGQEYLVQYFERTRFEYHPELAGEYQVLLGHLGRQHLAENNVPDWALQPVYDTNMAWMGVRPHHITIPRIGVDVTIAGTGFSYGEWDVPRYTAAHYWPISAHPGTAGNIIVAGHVGYQGTIFNQLPNVQMGDEIFLAVGQQNHRYVVQEVLTLLPSDTWVMDRTSTETLTLITCVPIGVYSHRLIVRADPA
ncbi:MAG: sortase [Chloroflexi bacterium AL-N10]|nr:sortase [Chloroflexi bacterium AL-N1]NOK69865.1 sortase [Chloroflexi bacterium AL-N10]NOK73838.1 sortase [Chloroflexi bacterium AL-N5]NOK91598.1 sortase [Chloroflexi bacterium AL-N15]